ncbi:MAG TPA: NAD(P)-binding domain-containing protein [Candidatus Eisenbacteria bacterium]
MRRWARWLHLGWPAGQVEKLPEVGPDGATSIPGVRIAGDLAGIPLLKFALDSGVRAVRAIAVELGPCDRAANGSSRRDPAEGPVDLVILGAGVAGMAAAVEAAKLGLRYQVIESAAPLSTLVNFPKGKPIYTYPADVTPAGELQVTATVKEALVDELEAQVARAGITTVIGRAERISRQPNDQLLVHLETGESCRARHVLVAIGRSGNHRRLMVPGEDRENVYNRLHDPADFAGRRVVVVGGGDSALEAAVALAEAGAAVTLSYRGETFARPKPENVAHCDARRTDADDPAPGRLRTAMGTAVIAIRVGSVDLKPVKGGAAQTIPNDDVFVLIGREAPLGFLRRSKLPIAGDMTPASWTALGLFVLFCAWLYNWKSGGAMSNLWYDKGWFPTNLESLTAAWSVPPTSLLGITVKSASGPSFWYTLAYSLLVTIFGVKRIRRRKTPYVTAQTLTLMAIQVVPLFLLPEIILPWLNYHALLPAGIADALFPVVNYGHGREFWRAYGLILAWPLMIYNIFTDQPLAAWLILGFVQTFVLIPAMVWFWGKGAYCGWICSCGALAETLGDTHRHRMPHGPGWNRLNFLGQFLLAVAFVMLGIRIAGWIWPHSWAALQFHHLKDGWKWIVDVSLAGILGYGLYFWYSGRTWCRFACPLAALMHWYARLGRFRILADKKKCISCNVCTSVCHQGIDIMNFANKGLPMADPQCVRCSACVQMCPTGVLSFGRVDGRGNVAAVDRLAASRARES